MDRCRNGLSVTTSGSNRLVNYSDHDVGEAESLEFVAITWRQDKTGWLVCQILVAVLIQKTITS